MASLEIEVAGRKYAVACRDGEEPHLRAMAAVVDKRARDIGDSLGNLPESRQLLFAALLLADDIKELKAGGTADPSPSQPSPPQPSAPEPSPPDPRLAEAAERLADRLEALAERLERGTGPGGALEDRTVRA